MSDSEEEFEEGSESEDDDEDYIPEEQVSDEDDIDFEPTGRKRRNTKTKQRTSKRKRRRGIKLEDSEEEDEEDEEDEEEFCANDEESEEEEEPNFDEDDEDEEKVGEENEEEEKKKEECAKSRVDNLWAEFKKDTSDIGKKESGVKDSEDKTASGEPAENTSSNDTPKKVEVTETYEFAGEEVQVTKSVDASSVENKEDTKKDSDATKSDPAVLKKKSTSGLGGLLGKLGKKSKLTTLEKSKLDWDRFKQDEGIEDDLKTSNKDGYLEKKAFLQRVDVKQFEIERDIREAGRKK